MNVNRWNYFSSCLDQDRAWKFKFKNVWFHQEWVLYISTSDWGLRINFTEAIWANVENKLFFFGPQAKLCLQNSRDTKRLLSSMFYDQHFWVVHKGAVPLTTIWYYKKLKKLQKWWWRLTSFWVKILLFGRFQHFLFFFVLFISKVFQWFFILNQEKTVC